MSQYNLDQTLYPFAVLATNVVTFSFNPDRETIDYIQAGEDSVKENDFESK